MGIALPGVLQHPLEEATMSLMRRASLVSLAGVLGIISGCQSKTSASDLATKPAAVTKIELKIGAYEFANRSIKRVDIAMLNKALKDKGLDGIPEVAEIGSNPKAFWKLLDNRLKAANSALGRDIHFDHYDDRYGGGHIYDMELCYKGPLEGVPEQVERMRGNFMNDEESVLAMAAGSKKIIIDDAFKSRQGLKDRFEDEYTTNLAEINSWLNYPRTSNKALIMSDYGVQGDGTELRATEVPACK